MLCVFTIKYALDARRRRLQQRGKADITAHATSIRATLFLSTGLLCMITIYLFAQNFFGEEMWIINAGYLGGSGVYYADHAAVWYQTMGSASSVVMNWMSDGYLVRTGLGFPTFLAVPVLSTHRYWLSLLLDISYICHLERKYFRHYRPGNTLRGNRRYVSRPMVRTVVPTRI